MYINIIIKNTFIKKFQLFVYSQYIFLVKTLWPIKQFFFFHFKCRNVTYFGTDIRIRNFLRLLSKCYYSLRIFYCIKTNEYETIKEYRSKTKNNQQKNRWTKKKNQNWYQCEIRQLIETVCVYVLCVGTSSETHLRFFFLSWQIDV